MQTMLTVVTQNSRLPRRSALSGDRMAFGFGYPHCSVPDAALAARCQCETPSTRRAPLWQPRNSACYTCLRSRLPYCEFLRLRME